mgnify:CR=1 FL=1
MLQPYTSALIGIALMAGAFLAAKLSAVHAPAQIAQLSRHRISDAHTRSEILREYPSFAERRLQSVRAAVPLE